MASCSCRVSTAAAAAAATAAVAVDGFVNRSSSRVDFRWWMVVM